MLRQALARLVASDASAAMCRRLRAEQDVPVVVCDVRRLPLPDASAVLVVGLNAVPALEEFARVLRPGGAVLWASSFGEETPLYVPPARLAAGWAGPAVTARAGHGDWLLLHKEAA